MRKIILLLSSLIASIANAEIVTTNEGYITRIHAYDDYMDGTVYVYISMSLEVCSSGTYLNPSSPGFERLYSIAMASMFAKKKVKFQLYSDRVNQNRCEVDAIQVASE